MRKLSSQNLFFGAFCQAKFLKLREFSAGKSSHAKKEASPVSAYFIAIR